MGISCHYVPSLPSQCCAEGQLRLQCILLATKSITLSALFLASCKSLAKIRTRLCLTLHKTRVLALQAVLCMVTET